MAVQLNYLLDQGGFVVRPDGTFARRIRRRSRPALPALTREIMTIQAAGRLREGHRAARSARRRAAAVKQALDKLAGVPVDIEPRFTTADELVAGASSSQSAAPPARGR